jgi:hypothetical protein
MRCSILADEEEIRGVRAARREERSFDCGWR